MLQTFMDFLVGIIALACIVIGLAFAAKMEARLSRLFGLLFIAFAIAVALTEGYKWTKTGSWDIVPAGKIWFDLHRESLQMLQPAIERYLHPGIWSAIQWVLEWPAWLAFTLIGLILLAVDHFHVARKPGPRPLPVLSRLYRKIVKPKPEEPKFHLEKPGDKANRRPI